MIYLTLFSSYSEFYEMILSKDSIAKKLKDFQNNK